MHIEGQFERGTIWTPDGGTDAATLDFIPHRAFPGVALKHLVTGDRTNGKSSCHLVKVAPHCCLSNHMHPQNLEIHQVVAGKGSAKIGAVRCEYLPGTVGVIPMDIPHEVHAGEEGLYILAVFSPALL